MTVTNPTSPAERQENEQKAIVQMKHGNIAGLAVLVQYYQVEAVQTALLILGDRGSAEEIVQEAFIKAYRKINQFDERRPFGPWFYRSVIHAALKEAKKELRVEPFEDTEEASQVASWLVDPFPEPHEIIEAKEVHEAIWLAMAKLNPNQRAAVVMLYFLDESEAEMIEELNRPLTTVKWWLHSARQSLRRLLQPTQQMEKYSQEIDHE